MINEMAKSILFLSLSGTVIALVLFILKPIIQNRVPRGWYYYMWLIVLVRLVVPFGLPIYIQAPSVQMPIPTVEVATEDGQSPVQMATPQASEAETEMSSNESIQPTQRLLPKPSALLPFLGWGWLGVSVLLLGKKLYAYVRFVHRVKGEIQPLADEILLAIYFDTCQVQKTKPIPVFTHPNMPSPMLMGFLCPNIVLPEKQLHQKVQLKYIFMHELTHYKRRDICYKWLMQVVLCLHWFNPVVYRMEKEIHKACELSCDESVIQHLTMQEQRAYGDTLLNALELWGGSRYGAVTLTLTENTKLMKERLGAIMKFHKKTKGTIIFSALLIAFLCVGSLFTGVEGATQDSQKSMENVGVPNTQHSITTIPTGNSTKIIVDMPINAGQSRGKNIGKFHLEEQDHIAVNLEWKGTGNVAFFYTKMEYTTAQLDAIFQKNGVPVSFSGIITNAPQSPMRWSNTKMHHEPGYYFFYVYAQNSKNMEDIQGDITITKNTTVPTSEKLDHMDTWSGSAGEQNTETGILLSFSNYTGDKINYMFDPGNQTSKTLRLNASLTGNYEIIWIMQDRTILKRIPAFVGYKDITLTGLPSETISMIVRGQNISGSLVVEDRIPVAQSTSNVIDLTNRNSFNISESGTFEVKENGVLKLAITSSIRGGTVDLFLFDPNRKEQRISIGGTNSTKEIPVTKGIWQYNCSGMFKDGGTIKIIGTIEKNKTDSVPTNSKTMSAEQANKRAIDIMTQSGTWGAEINSLLPSMTPDAVNKVVGIYLERHLFPGITSPEGAKQVRKTIQPALPYLTEGDRKTAEQRISAYDTISKSKE